MPRNKGKRNRQGSRKVAVSIQIAEIITSVGQMVPVAGPFIKGIAETAKLLLDDMEKFKTNSEDMEHLADDILDIVRIIRDAGMQVSAMPEGVRYAVDLRAACLDFQEFLIDISTQLNEMRRNKGGVQRKILDFFASRDIREDISCHRRVVDNARANFQTQLLLNLFQVAVNSDTTISRMNEQISVLQSTVRTSIVTAPPISTTTPIVDPVNHGNETQLMRHYYRMPGGIDLVEGLQDINVRAHSASVVQLINWFCRLHHHFLFLWWYFHFRWAFSPNFEISLASSSHRGLRIWAVLIGIDAYPGAPLRGCVTDALAMETYLIKNLGVPKGQIQRLISSKYPSSSGSSIGITHHYSYPTRANIIDTLLGLSKNRRLRKATVSSFYSRDAVRYSTSKSTSENRWHHRLYKADDFVEVFCPIDRGIIGDKGASIPNISEREINNILHIIHLYTGAHVTFIVDCKYDFGVPDIGNRTAIPLGDSGVRMFNSAKERIGDWYGYRDVWADTWNYDIDSHTILGAGGRREVATECQYPNRFGGAFTQALVKMLKSGSLNEEATYVDLSNALPRLYPTLGGAGISKRLSWI
ncbi:uncharacterized protein EV420DRAFT_1753140 [Desarmillaria tabescens]|uniref:Peptidase C14 caspase domain-containing protein n=1 Tax=Armillaria tabescens TaxID=1929756 RepID=A0AA39JB50_ARMTA|nr:uncharacterized protein EV420DRAFT_1753140 [Desarmillaria tabescens]KAK0438732.1 hypothetical protein EV420DRAFT_1753140 [Desarmillaria tabescens]